MEKRQITYTLVFIPSKSHVINNIKINMRGIINDEINFAVQTDVFHLMHVIQNESYL